MHPDYVASRADADNHEHEHAGGTAIYRGQPPASSTERRLILRNLVFAGAGGFPTWLRQELLEALDALDVGSTLPLLEPARKRGTSYEKARAELELIGFVRFRADAYGGSVDEAFEFVADHVHLGADAIKKWEQRLKTSCLSELEVDRYLVFVRNAASHVREANRKLRDGGAVSQLERAASDRKESQFGTSGLLDAAARWRKLQRT